MQKLKRWLPFMIIISGAFITFVYLVFSGGTDPYIPNSDDPEIIYRDACSHCHGLNGEGDGLLYPAFDNENLTMQDIKKSISEGSWRMPDFENIRNDTLNILVLYIYEKQYLNRSKSD